MASKMGKTTSTGGFKGNFNGGREMKSVLISIQPKWCELIANGKKTIEVRKSRPKIETPFKVYIYCTYGNEKENYCVGKRGKVIGEFVCDRIYSTLFWSTDGGSADRRRQYHLMGENDEIIWRFWRESCLQPEELAQYIKKEEMCYGWHISDLKIYDKPKELGEFFVKGDCENFDFCYRCKYYYRGDAFSEAAGIESGCTLYDDLKSLYRPPQSWCYVEE